MAFTKKAGSSKSSGKTGKTKAKAKPAKITFDAPSDMKPCFIEFFFRTQEDGLIGGGVKCQRVKGNWSNPEAKRFDMLEYDPQTVIAITSRFAARTFATNAGKRLPANTAFKIIIRAGLRKADNTLMGGVKSIAILKKSEKTGKSRWAEIEDAKDPVRRKLRSVGRFIPGAFVNLQLPPSTRRSKKDADEE